MHDNRVSFRCDFQKRMTGEIGINDGYLFELDTRQNGNEGKDLNVFLDFTTLISLVKLVKGKFQDQDIKSWVEANGFLTVSSNEGKEPIYQFRDEAIQITDIWKKYQQVTQTNFAALNKWISYELKQTLDNEISGCYPVYETPLSTDVIIFRKPIEEVRANPDPYLRQSGFGWVMAKVLSHTGSYSIVDYAFGRNYTVTPSLIPSTLLQALYLQFLLLLSDQSKKICPVCYQFFQPKRPDQIYCPPLDGMKHSTCKLTDKSRRYRERKKAINTE